MAGRSLSRRACDRRPAPHHRGPVNQGVSTKVRGNITAILCGKCRREIEHCYGDHGSWMHSSDRREACPHGGYAIPETVAQFDDRTKYQGIRESRARRMSNLDRVKADDAAFQRWRARRGDA